MSSLGQQIRQFWQNQPSSRRITIIGLLAVAVVAIVGFSIWAATPSYSVLYSGLSETDAGQIVEKLQEQGTPYQLKNNTTILVPSEQVYEVRLAMANAGLPESSSVGYELFNSNSLIMTEFTQQVNYQRALEGELERTIDSLDAIEASDVHIVIPEDTLLIEDEQPATASVTLQIAAGDSLNSAQVRSITYLIASSVEGMKPGDVVVVDTEGNMLAGGEDTQTLSAGADSQYSIELAAANSIKKKVEDLLSAVLGPNRSVVQASVVMDWTERETTSVTYDPTATTLRSSQKISESYSTGNSDSGVPGAETNLPDTSTVVPTTTGSVYDYNRVEETYNYEITEIQEHEVQTPGKIEQISLSVLVDGVEDEEQLATIREAVSAAAGIDVEGRGDVISVSSLNFDTSYQESQAEAITKQNQVETYMEIGKIAVPALIILALLLVVGRLFKGLRTSAAQEWTPILRPVTEAALAAPQMQPMIGDGRVPGAMQVSAEGPEQIGAEGQPKPEAHAEVEHKIALPEIKKPTQSAEEEQLQRVITRIAEENPATVAEIIQLWLSEEGN